MALENEEVKKTVRKKKLTIKQQKELEKRQKIEALTEQRDELQREYDAADEKRAEIHFPLLAGKQVEHTQYGPGTVIDQKDSVLTVQYGDVIKKQKLPFVLVSGYLQQDDDAAVDTCRRISELDEQLTSIRKKINVVDDEIGVLEKE